ncbi:MAG: (4Fe-4S)-binding protein, partial [Kiritimatiellae bacterium]|nr:(4Fe-4S)-binding protein [Kiritimatiellia bacterium]
PGTSCPVVATVRDTDYVLLVTEPTPFGLNDLKLAVEMIRQLGLRHGVVINRADSGDRRVREFCVAERIPVLLELPDDRRVAEAYSRGQLALQVLPEWRMMFSNLLNHIEGEVCR